MLVVPIHKDTILTKDGNKLRVIEYTNYKEGGPAVYAKSPAKEVILVYFFDIAEINGTKVEYERSSKVFRAFGKIFREQHLPQPDDTIIVLKNSISDEDQKSSAKVESLKLKSKLLGVNKGLLIKDDQGNYYRLKQILDIERALGGNNFDRDVFMAMYKDYAGV
jgi:hypothetical protein